MRLSLDWVNLFGGMDSHQITSVIVTAIIFTAAAGLCLMALVAFGVRGGLMAATHTTNIPPATDLELGSFLAASAFAMVSIILMIFTGPAENNLDNPTFFPLAVGPILLGGLFLVTGAGLAFRTVRGRRSVRSQRA